MENSIQLLANEFQSKQDLLKSRDYDGGYSVTLPIKKICGLPVAVDVEIKKYNFIFRIRCCRLLCYTESGDCFNSDELYSHYEDTSSKMAMWVLETLPKLRFNKLTSRFEILGKFVNTDFVSIFSCISDCETIEFSFQKCCICFEATNRKTGCGHPLCAECWCKIKGVYLDKDGDEVEDDEEAEFVIRCPLCRKDIQKID